MAIHHEEHEGHEEERKKILRALRGAMLRPHAVFRAVVASLTIVLAVAFARVAQDRIDAMRDDTSVGGFDEGLLYLPNERLLNHFTAGMSSVVADLLWLKTIRYTVEEFHNVDRKFTWLEHMCNTVTQLDPYFTGAYVYGGMLLAVIGADDKALSLLQRGIVNSPQSWEIPFEIAKIYILNRRARPESPAMAAFYLQAVAERSDKPAFFIEWIQRLDEEHDLARDARTVWEMVLRNNDDEFILELAREELVELDIRDNVALMAQGVEQYRARFARNPAAVEDLVTAGLLSPLPENEEHGTYLLDSQGNPQNTVLLDHLVEQVRGLLNDDLARFKDENGQVPETLQAWADWREQDVPPHPYEDRQWHYSPATGQVD